jgi:hypothetical protein
LSSYGNWEEVALDETLPQDQGNFHDQNSDGAVCKFSNPNKNPSEFPDWIVKDNTNKAKNPK